MKKTDKNKLKKIIDIVPIIKEREEKKEREMFQALKEMNR